MKTLKICKRSPLALFIACTSEPHLQSKRALQIKVTPGKRITEALF